MSVSCGKKSEAFSGLSVLNSFVARGASTLADARVCKLSVSCIEVPDKVITAVIGPVGTPVPQGSTLFASVQAAVDEAQRWDLGVVTLQLPPGTFAEDILFANESSRSTLIVTGPFEAQFGLGFMNQGTNVPQDTYPPELGSGQYTLTTLGNTITIATTGFPTTLNLLNIAAGDRILLYDDNGTTSTSTIVGVSPTVITLATPPPPLANAGSGFTFLPRTQLLSASLGGRGGPTCLEALFLTGPGVIAVDPNDQSPWAPNPAVVQSGTSQFFLRSSVVRNTSSTGIGVFLQGFQDFPTELTKSTVVANQGVRVSAGALLTSALLIWVTNSIAQRGYGLATLFLGSTAGSQVNIAGLANADLLYSASLIGSMVSLWKVIVMDGSSALGDASGVHARSGKVQLNHGAATHADVSSISGVDALFRVSAQGVLILNVNPLSLTDSRVLGAADHVVVHSGSVAFAGAGNTFTPTGGSFVVNVPKTGSASASITAGTYAVAARIGGVGDEIAVGDNVADYGTTQTDHLNATDTRPAVVGLASYTGVDD